MQPNNDGAGAPPLNWNVSETADDGPGESREPMTLAEQSVAKQFFVAKILAEARAQRVPVSAAEQYMLSWSESDPHVRQDPALTAAFEAETNDTDFESKVADVPPESDGSRKLEYGSGFGGPPRKGRDR